MKEIQKQRTVTSNYTVYQASDGTEFDCKRDCEVYENSALGVILSRVQCIKVSQISEYDLFDTGSEEYIFEVYNVETEGDIMALGQLLSIYQTGDDPAKDFFETCEQVTENLQVVISHNRYDRQYYFQGTVDNFINKIKQKLLNK